MEIGEKIILLKEPANKFDPNAIAIYYKETHIGYIPRENNVEIGKLLDYNVISKGEITALNKNELNWAACEVCFFAKLANKENGVRERISDIEWWNNLTEEWRELFLKKINFTMEPNNLPKDMITEILLELNKMETLFIWNNEGDAIQDLSPLAKLKNLKKIQLRINRITDIFPLSELKNLSILDLGRIENQINLQPLLKLKNLKSFYINNQSYFGREIEGFIHNYEDVDELPF